MYAVGYLHGLLNQYVFQILKGIFLCIYSTKEDRHQEATPECIHSYIILYGL